MYRQDIVRRLQEIADYQEASKPDDLAERSKSVVNVVRHLAFAVALAPVTEAPRTIREAVDEVMRAVETRGAK